MDNSTFTLADAARTRSIVHEDTANRALRAADWALDCDNVPEAIGAYRRAARAFTRAAELRADASAAPGGTALDRRCVEWFRNHAEAAHATADRLESGYVAGVDGGA